MGYKNIMPMDAHIHSLSAKGIKSRIQDLVIFSKKDVLSEYEVRDLEKKAIANKFYEEDGIYVDWRQIERRSDTEETLQETYIKTKRAIVDVFGSMEHFNLMRDYVNIRGRYSWVNFEEVKGNKVLGTSTFSVTLPLDSVYSLATNILKGKRLKDYSEFSKFSENQKTEYYSENGTVKTDLVSMKRYKNGKSEFTFNSEQDAKKFFDTTMALQKEYYGNRSEIDRWMG